MLGSELGHLLASAFTENHLPLPFFEAESYVAWAGLELSGVIEASLGLLFFSPPFPSAGLQVCITYPGT